MEEREYVSGVSFSTEKIKRVDEKGRPNLIGGYRGVR